MTIDENTITKLSSQLEAEQGSESEFRLLFERANAYQQIGKTKEALIDFYAVASESRNKKLMCRAKAMITLICLEAGETKESLWWALASLNHIPSDVNANAAIGLALKANEFYRLAIPYFRQVCDQDGESIVARRSLAVCLRETLDFSAAHETLLGLLEIAPNDAQTYFELGRNWNLRYDIPDHKLQARLSFQKALELGPSEELRISIVKKLEGGEAAGSSVTGG
ncbi:hypothetical protein [Blastopirellula retiformator]|uniref:Tetratricopeptide repeat protein n=1 Tax=Blastopirellula retiformator TaxID=2527970 RepID=A0A5C5V8J4_9BACT|nr:hypothetical protein [Blastopirellula retiformator]TWT34167.1 Tetratricopeptide repeat protein [Blastopirellula retiformator]